MKTTTFLTHMLGAAACCAAVAALGQSPIVPPPHPYGLPVPPQAPKNLQWLQMPQITAQDIGVGGGVAWVIGTAAAGDGYAIYRWDGNAWTNVPGSGVRLDVDPQGNAWIVTKSHEIRRFLNGGFYPIPLTVPATDIGIGADGSVWVIGTDTVGNDYSIYRLTDTGWRRMPGAGVRIDVDPHGSAWVVNSSHQILQWVGQAWKQIPGTATDIGIGAQGSVYIVDPSGRIFTWSNGGWALVPGGLTSISVDQYGSPWGTNATNQVWASFVRAAPTSSFVSIAKPTTITASAPISSQGASYQETNYPGDQPCPTTTYTVPWGATYVRITATGGAGLGSDAQNAMATFDSVVGVGTGNTTQSGPAPDWANIAGGTGGHGAKVSAIFPVNPFQKLYVLAGLNAFDAARSNLGIMAGYPGGGVSGQPGGGLSMVSTYSPARSTNDSNGCIVPMNSLLVVAGGGGGAGLSGSAGHGGNGGDAGGINQNGNTGASGGGGMTSGGGANGGTMTAGGPQGSHNGCGSEARYAGGYLRGGDTWGSGGGGGAGYYGGGAGGGGDCFLDTGSGGGGGGSSYVASGAIMPTSSSATKYDAGVVIEPVQPR
jgi:hypothetical protein